MPLFFSTAVGFRLCKLCFLSTVLCRHIGGFFGGDHLSLRNGIRAAFCIAALIYITLKPYPMDYVDSKLLVDPERMNKDRYGDIGMLLALCGARFIEKTWIKYKPTGTKDLWELY